MYSGKLTSESWSEMFHCFTWSLLFDGGYIQTENEQLFTHSSSKSFTSTLYDLLTDLHAHTDTYFHRIFLPNFMSVQYGQQYTGHTQTYLRSQRVVSALHACFLPEIYINSPPSTFLIR